MNRRRFLSFLPALAAVPLVAALPKPKPKPSTRVVIPPLEDGQMVTVVGMRGQVFVMQEVGSPALPYHPNCLCLAPEEGWKEGWDL